MTPGGTIQVKLGQPLTLEGRAEGSSPLMYQWHKDGRALPGETGPVLEIPRMDKASAGTYVLLVRNVAGTAVSAGTHVRLKQP